MISKRISPRKDGKSSALASLRYGEGLSSKSEHGVEGHSDKSHRTRLGNFDLVEDDLVVDGIYAGRSKAEMAELIRLAAIEMQANCDQNTRVWPDKKIAHFVVSFNQPRPTDAALRDTEDSMLSALGLNENHWASFLHNDNGYWHLHIFASRIDKVKHLGNPLWQDRTIRDRVCKEVELRHGLIHDNGLHEVNELGQIVEVPRDKRRRRRSEKSEKRSDRAITMEKYSGEKSFQAWAIEVRLGDRLKHAKGWEELHAAAGEYGCQIKQKGAGYFIAPIDGKGGIQLYKIGLKGLNYEFGPFRPAGQTSSTRYTSYSPEPIQNKSEGLYEFWKSSKASYQPVKAGRLKALRDEHRQIRVEVKAAQRAELHELRSKLNGVERQTGLSVAKMQHAISLSDLAEKFAAERKQLYADLAAAGPGNTFREFLVREARKGSNAALGLARQYGANHATDVSRRREIDHLQISAAMSGSQLQPATRLRFTHYVANNGSVVYQLGNGRIITDSAISRQVQLNREAEHDPAAIETALRFASLKFGNKLVLTGSQDFQRRAVEVAVSKGIWVNFADPNLEKYRQQLLEAQRHKPQFPSKERHHASDHPIQRFRQIPPAHIRNRLHNLPLGDLVLHTDGAVGTLWQDVPHRLEQQKQGDDNGMQRTAGRSERVGSDAASDSQGIAIPVTQDEGNQRLAAELWAMEWARARNKEVIDAPPGDSVVPFKVIHVADGFAVLDRGRTISIHNLADGVHVEVNDMVVVDKNRGVLLQQKSIKVDQGRDSR